MTSKFIARPLIHIKLYPEYCKSKFLHYPGALLQLNTKGLHEFYYVHVQENQLSAKADIVKYYQHDLKVQNVFCCNSEHKYFYVFGRAVTFQQKQV